MHWRCVPIKQSWTVVIWVILLQKLKTPFCKGVKTDHPQFQLDFVAKSPGYIMVPPTHHGHKTQLSMREWLTMGSDIGGSSRRGFHATSKLTLWHGFSLILQAQNSGRNLHFYILSNLTFANFFLPVIRFSLSSIQASDDPIFWRLALQCSKTFATLLLDSISPFCQPSSVINLTAKHKVEIIITQSPLAVATTSFYTIAPLAIPIERRGPHTTTNATTTATPNGPQQQFPTRSAGVVLVQGEKTPLNHQSGLSSKHEPSGTDSIM